MPSLPENMTLFLLNRNYSSWSLRAWIAMRAFNLKFDIVMLMVGTKEIQDLGTPEADALMSRAGPTSKVPALHINDGKFVVFETLAIIEFLAESVDGMWPKDHLDRAYARSLSCEMLTGFSAVRSYSMNLREHRPFQPELFTAQAEKEFSRLASIWEELRVKATKNCGDKEDKGFLFGSFTALDAMYAPVMFRLRSYGLMEKITGEHARAYVNRMLEYEPLKEWEALAAKETEIIPRGEYPHPMSQNREK
ncbi:hypothetical protein BGZ83_002831 [Gryganskiella cystojenkinii]|nr:hypothetical protein BGZ83_002831 [Gryganskiella cystojenkinii]